MTFRDTDEDFELTTTVLTEGDGGELASHAGTYQDYVLPIFLFLSSIGSKSEFFYWVVVSWRRDTPPAIQVHSGAV